jgi:hypothetical protein
LAEEKKEMSNPRKWRGKGRTPVPNSRQKRNKLFIDAHPRCQRCNRRDAEEAHHELPKGHPQRHDWRFMKALCTGCHVQVHRQLTITLVISSGA